MFLDGRREDEKFRPALLASMCRASRIEDLRIRRVLRVFFGEMELGAYPCVFFYI
jgi:hypothetical protein